MQDIECYDVAIIGGGPAGLTAAHLLSRNNLKVVVLEKDSIYLGGISKTVEYKGFRFDIGGHRFFSKSNEVVQFWKEILGSDLLVRQRRSRIYYNKKFFPYPLDVIATLKNLGLIESLLCGLSFLSAKISPRKDVKSFEDWVSNNFGSRLFNIFFKTYTEKVWGIPCSKISADWAQQRIKGMSFFSVLKNALQSLFKLNKANTPKSLIEEFLYPRLGPGMLWTKVGSIVEERGGKVVKSFNTQKLIHKDNYWSITSESGEEVTANTVISSMPLRELIFAIEGMSENAKESVKMLRYRDFITVALILKRENEIEDNWVYIHDPEVRVGRIQNFRAWSPEMLPDENFSCYGLEYFCNANDTFWNMSDDELINLAKDEIVKINLAKKDQVVDAVVVRQEKAYPVYDENYKEVVEQIKNYLKAQAPNLQIVGRNGMHKYNNQDHSMMTAILAAKNIMAGKEIYNLWAVNQDAEYHESGASGERIVPTLAT